MSGCDRRSFLGGMSAGFLAGRPGGTGGSSGITRLDGHGLDELVALVRAMKRAELLDRALALHQNGVDWRDLLAAAFLAGIRDVEPRPVGFQFHCVMMTSSAYQIAARLPANERLAVALYNLDDFKQSQARDARGGEDWQLEASKVEPAADPVAAIERFAGALSERDGAAADAAAVQLAQCADLDAAFEPLWWFGMRDFTNIGHHPIFVAQSHRTLQQIGWRHGTDVMRSLAHGLLDEPAADADATFRSNGERAKALAKAMPDRAPEASRSTAGPDAALLELLRGADPDRVAAAVLDRIVDGLDPGIFWNTLRLFAAEQVWRLPGILSVHAVTSIDAFRYTAARARQPETRAMAMLQAASWQVLYRDFLAGRSGYGADAPGLDRIEPAGAAVADPFELAARDHEAAASAVLAAGAERLEEYGRMARRWLVRKVHEHHDYKFAAALLAEVAAADPDTACRMFAAGLRYLRKPGDADHALWSRLSR